MHGFHNLSSVILKLQDSHAAPFCTHISLVFNQNAHFDLPAAVQKQYEYFQEAGEMPAAVWKTQLVLDCSIILHMSLSLNLASVSHIFCLKDQQQF